MICSDECSGDFASVPIMFLVHNERTKLTANWLNTLATALVAAGGFAPAAAVLYGITNVRLELGFVAGILLGCMTLGLVIHLGAWAYLRRMRE